MDCVNDFQMLFNLENEASFQAVRNIKNMVIGNDRQKTIYISSGIVPRLIAILLDENCPTSLHTEATIVLGSLAKGSVENIQALIDADCVSILFKVISQSDLKLIEAALRCLRSIFLSTVAPVDLLFQDPNTVPHLIRLCHLSYCTIECVTNIFSNCCQNVIHQTMLCSSGTIQTFAPFLNYKITKIQLPALKCFAQLCFQNQQVALAISTAICDGESIISLIVRLVARNKPTEMQLAAARCLTNLYRAGAIDSTNNIISHKTLLTLVRMCQSDRAWEERVEAAETLAYLIEVDTKLQQTAATCDHIIQTFSDYFHYPGSPPDVSLMPVKKDDIIVGNELRQAAFRAYASLGANDEDIRKRIIETENLMDHIVNGLSDPVTKVQLAAVRCMHSLSRSVQQLRTSFQDHHVWKPLMKIMNNASDDVLTVASSTLCNLLLEFSPSKEPMLELGVIDILVSLTRNPNPSLRLNGIWALMNMAFQAEQKIKSQIFSSLGTEHLFQLLCDSDVNILMKTLGLLRNLLSNKPHIDSIMETYGREIMQAVIVTLEGDHTSEVKEQALCILANVADGDSAKSFILTNEDVLKMLMNYMVHTNVELQIASTFCISNLLWSPDEGIVIGALERQTRLKELGVPKLLQQLLNTSNPTLFERVKTALEQF